MLPIELVPLTGEQHTIIDLCRTFGTTEIRPAAHAAGLGHAADVDSDSDSVADADSDSVADAADDLAVASAHALSDLWRKAAKAGIARFMLPRAYGGGGFTDVFTQALAQEELCAADAAIGNLLTSAGRFADPVAELGTPAQKERWLRPLSVDEPALSAIAVSEPHAGDDPTAITTKARRVGGGYKLTGQKASIGNGGVADFYLIFATLDAVARAKGVTAFLVEKGTPGLSFGKPVHADGHPDMVSTEVFLDHVFVPDGNRLGGEGQGIFGLTQATDRQRVISAASATGLARACLELTASFVRESGAVLEADVVSLLAEMATRVEASRLLVWRAAKSLDNGSDGTSAAAMAKRYANETAIFCSRAAVQTLGESGHPHGQLVERWTHHAQAYEAGADVTAMITVALPAEQA
jgi:alkylation response protein AidB-like acyl-CoA dehydrogenase